MFYECKSLTSIINLSKLDTSQVTNMAGMFVSCFLLTSLNLSNFNTDKIIDIAVMFRGSKNLEYINLQNALISNSASIYNVRYGRYILLKILLFVLMIQE